MTEEVYLGDGLYARVEGSMIRLRAPRDDDTDSIVYLELEVYAALREFARKVGFEPETP